MSKNQFTTYYVNQAGSGLTGYRGSRFQYDDQIGEGFLDIIKSIGMPILKYLGKKALNTGIGVAQDALKGENLLQSTKRNLKRTAQDMANDAGERAIRFAQTGKGRRRRRRMKKKNSELIIKKRRLGSKLKKSKKVKRRKTSSKRRRKRRTRVKNLFE